MDDAPTEYADSPFRLVPCDICGRKFKEDRFGKHYDVCKKSAQKTRKVFDSSKQRAEGTEINSVKPSRATGRAAQSRIPAKKSNWREKHDEFIRNIRHAKMISDAEQRGDPLPPPPPPAANPDYVTCEYCNRRFNVHAAERHIPFCREQAARIPKNKPGVENARMKQNIRTKYQPPPPKAKNGSGSSGYGDHRSGGSSQRTQASSGYGRQNGYQPSRYSSGDRKDGNPPSSQTGSMIPNGKSLRTGKSQQQYLAYREEHLRDSPSNGGYQHRSGMGGSSGGSNRSRSGSGSMERSPSVDSLNNHYSSTAHVTNKRYGFNAGKPPLKQNPSHLDSLSHGEQRNGSAGPSKFCHECGSKHPIPSARFCCMCGVRRMTVAN